MNRLILKYGKPLTAAILAVFAWVIYRRTAGGDDLLPLAVTAITVWGLGTPAFILLWPRLTVNGYKRAILRHGLGGGPVPVNTLCAARSTPSPAAPRGSLLATGTGDLLYVGGWLDLRTGPQVLHVPDMAGRYFSVQFTDPSTSANFAYVGTRATGTRTGDYLLSGPGWVGRVPNGMSHISSPKNSALVIGRIRVRSDSDLQAASALGQQMQLSPLNQ